MSIQKKGQKINRNLEDNRYDGKYSFSVTFHSETPSDTCILILVHKNRAVQMS